MKLKFAHFRLLFLAVICVLLCPLLSSCAGAGDYAVSLTENYAVWRCSAYEVLLCCGNTESGRPVIEAYVGKVACTEDYIFVQQMDVQKNQRGHNYVDFNDPKAYYGIVISTDEVIGPMDQEQFDDWFATLGLNADPIWIRTDQSALLNYQSSTEH